jgi:hypothetical protein
MSLDPYRTPARRPIERQRTARVATGGSLTIGMIIAGICSWSTWHSVPWALVHGLCSWLYIIYWAVTQP